MKFEDIKFTIAKIQFENLSLNEGKTAIEANPSTHKIAEWVYNTFCQLEPLVSGKFAEETFELVINNLLENRPLYKDSGLWQIRSEDMNEVLYQQDVNETFIEFINRVFKSENQLQEL